MMDWDIALGGRPWTTVELSARIDLIPERIEVIGGKMLRLDAERLTLLAMLLENVGMLAAVQLGSAGMWKLAVDMTDGIAPSPDQAPSAE